MLSSYSAKKPLTIIVCIVLVVVLGIVSFTKMSTDLLPSFDLPYVVVYTTYPGASPEKVETSLTRVLEAALGTTGGLNSISSVSSENLSLVVLEFAYSTNMDSVLIEMNNSLGQVESYLPDGVGAPVLMQIDPDMLPLLVSAVSVEGMDEKQAAAYVEENVIPALERVSGVAEVSAMGLVKESVEVRIDKEALARINKKLQDSAGEEFAEPQAEIDKGFAELQEGRESLDGELADKLKELSSAAKQIREGRMSIAEGYAQLDAAEAALDSAYSEVLSQGGQLEQLFAALDSIGDIDSAISQAQAALSGLELALKLAEEGVAGAEAYLKKCQEELAAAELSTPSDLITEADIAYRRKKVELAQKLLTEAQNAYSLALSQYEEMEANIAQLQELKDFLAGMGIESTEELEALRAQYESGLAQISAGYGEIAARREELKALEAELDSGESQIKKGESAIESAKEEAAAQMDEAEAQLKDAQAQLDSAREEVMAQIDVSKTITEDMIAQLLTASNLSMPAGYLYDSETGDNSYTVKVGEEFSSLKALRNFLLFDLGGDVGPVYLKDVAAVTLADDSADSYARINGQPGILLTVQKQSTASTTEVSAALKEAIAAMEAEDSLLRFTALSDQGDYINIIVASVLQNLLYGALLAMLVLLIFLKSLRPTLIVALSIPLSLLIAVVCMYFSGISLNLISLGGLALAIGMLVDNSIVVIENIYRLRGEGVPLIRAVVQGAKEMTGPIIASTLTTACVFLPIVFAEGIARELFVDMGLTIAYSLLASLIVALCVVPALSSLGLGRERVRENRGFARLQRGYKRSLSFVLRHRFVSLVLVTALLVFSVYSALSAGTAFLPDSEWDQLSVSVSPGDEDMDTETLRANMDALSSQVMALSGVQSVGVLEGGGMMMGGSGGSMTLYIILDPERSVAGKEITARVEEICASLGLSADTASSGMDMSALAGSGIQVDLYGSDLETLRQLARDIAEKLRAVEGVAAVDDGIGETSTETLITVDKNKAMEYGLTVAQVYSAVASALSRQQSSTTLSIDNSSYEVVIIKNESDYITREALEDITIEGARDNESVQVPIGDIAQISDGETQASISRSDNKRTLTVDVSVAAGYNVGNVSQAVSAALSGYSLPNGCSMDISGEAATINETLMELVNMALIAVLLIYLIMVAQFQSLLSPFIVMFTIPLAFTGGLLLEWALGMELSVMSALGLLVLLGVVVNNGIVFVDTANGLFGQGMEKREALCETGARRMRPILMTAMTTVLGLLTLALGIGTGADLLQPMAVVVIGGLSYATILTLYVVPVLYDIFCKRPPRQVVFEEEA